MNLHQKVLVIRLDAGPVDGLRKVGTLSRTPVIRVWALDKQSYQCQWNAKLTRSHHVRKLVTSDGHTLNGVVNEIVELVAAEGYEFVRADGTWCSTVFSGGSDLTYRF